MAGHCHSGKFVIFLQMSMVAYHFYFCFELSYENLCVK